MNESEPRNQFIEFFWVFNRLVGESYTDRKTEKKTCELLAAKTKRVLRKEGWKDQTKDYVCTVQWRREGGRWKGCRGRDTKRVANSK